MLIFFISVSLLVCLLFVQRGMYVPFCHFDHMQFSHYFPALQAGIDSANGGVLAPVYKMRAYKVLSLMTAPWLLPIDLAMVLAKK